MTSFMHFAGIKPKFQNQNLLKARVVIASYNDHCSAPLSRALLVGS